MDTVSYSKPIPITAACDIIVCGGGAAGFCAALASARFGAKTCLIEKNNMLGGIMTAGGNNDIGLFCAGEKQVISGIGWEFVNRLNEMGFAKIPEFKAGITHSRQGVKVNIPMAAYLMDTMCLEEKVDLLFGATIVDVLKQDDSWLVIYAKKGRLCAVLGKYVIDCTGDGDASVCAGANYELGESSSNTSLQPGTLRFFPSTFEATDISKDEMRNNMVEQIQNGSLIKSDFWPGVAGDPREIFTHHGDNINHIEINSDYEQCAEKIEIEGRRSLARVTNWVKKNFPSKKDFSMEYLCDGVAYRETRRVRCDYYITVDDYVSAKKWEDSICYAYYPVDLHQHEKISSKNVHQIHLDTEHIPTIPLRALIVAGLDRFLVAGRCISSDRLANSALRVKAPCMAMGQAAGTAAALALRSKTDVRNIDIHELKTALSDSGCIVP